MSTSTFPSPDRTLPCISQWGDLGRNDDVVVRRNHLSEIEVYLADVTPSRLHHWASDGYGSLEEYLFWSRRVCGLACLQSLLQGWTDVRLSMGELLAEALDWGCYVVESPDKVHGLIYRPFVAWVSAQFGLHCELIEHTPIQRSARRVRSGQVMIASVSPEIRDPDTPDPRKGGHLVLVHAVHDDDVSFHNPSGYSHNSAHASLPMHQFERFHADRGILVAPGPAGRAAGRAVERQPAVALVAARRQRRPWKRRREGT